MPSIDLEVPYQQKELAKALGARWDARRKVWYVVDRDDLTPFAKWLPQPPRVNHRADSYVLLESRRDCWKCGHPAADRSGFRLSSRSQCRVLHL